MSEFDDTLNQINPQQLIDKALTKGILLLSNFQRLL